LTVLHTPVLLAEILDWLRIRPEGTYADVTVGTGGHTLEIAKRLTTGQVLGLDRDPRALEIARERLGPHERQVILVHAEFSKIGEVAAANQLPRSTECLLIWGFQASSWIALSADFLSAGPDLSICA